MEAWLDAQLGLIDDVAASARFAAWCPVPQVPESAYRHRILPGDPALLAGIRFKGGDLAQAFVDLLAWDGVVGAGTNARLIHAFREFAPKMVRVRWPGAEEPPLFTQCSVDQVVLSGPLEALKRRPRPVGTLVLEPATDLAWYDEFRAEFAAWQGGAGPLGAEVFPASKEDFEGCLQSGAVLCAMDEGHWVGVIATRREAERFGEGYCVTEEFLAASARGRGLAAALQRGLIDALPAKPGDLLWGTISHANQPSQRTASRCGREVIETWWFGTPA